MKKTRKSTLFTAIALVLCFSTLLLTAFAATKNLSSYETLKNALLNFNTFENGTITANLNVSDNGKEILSTNLTSKMQDYQNSSSIVDFTVNGKTNKFESWETPEQLINKDSSNEYYNVVEKSLGMVWTNDVEGLYPAVKQGNSYTTYVYSSDDDEVSINFEGNSQDLGYDGLTSTQQKLINSAIDLAVGDVKNYFTSNGNVISLKLEKSQIPQIAQLLAAVAGEEFNKLRDFDNIERIPGTGNRSASINDMLVNLPQFSEDTEIKSASADITLNDDNQISAMKVSFTITATDTDGVVHNLVFDADIKLSDLGTTTADTVDLTGKEVLKQERNFMNFEIFGNEVEHDD